jgi:hypothetical protein
MMMTHERFGHAHTLFPRIAWPFPAADGSFTELCRMLDSLPLMGGA